MWASLRVRCRKMPGKRLLMVTLFGPRSGGARPATKADQAGAGAVRQAELDLREFFHAARETMFDDAAEAARHHAFHG